MKQHHPRRGDLLPRPSVAIVPVLCVCLLLVSGCITRHTKAFFMEGHSAESLEYREKFTFENFLPEQFHNWLVGVSVWSVWKNEDRSQYRSDEYDLSILFILPDDTAQDLRSFAPRADNAPEEIRVDSMFIEFLPSGEHRTLLPLSQRTRLQRRVEFDLLRIPDEVEAIKLRFTAWLVDPDGTLIDGQTFTCRLDKYHEAERRILPSD